MLHTSPDASEVVTAVREFLESEVVPNTDATVSYHARVAATLLRALEREAALGPEPEARMAATLRSWDVPDEAALAARVRRGELTSRTPGLLRDLRGITEDRLAAWNPRHTSSTGDDDPRRPTTPPAGDHP